MSDNWYDIVGNVGLGIGGVGSLINAGTGIADTVLGYQQFDYMKAMQQKAWQREDSAIQRRVADLKAAGLSPVLAAGQGASSSGPINVTAPRISGAIGTPLQDMAKIMMGLMSQQADISKTLASERLIKAQTEKAETETSFMTERNPLLLEKQRMENYFGKSTLMTRIDSEFLKTDKNELYNRQIDLTNKIKEMIPGLTTVQIAQIVSSTALNGKRLLESIASESALAKRNALTDESVKAMQEKNAILKLMGDKVEEALANNPNMNATQFFQMISEIFPYLGMESEKWDGSY